MEFPQPELSFADSDEERTDSRHRTVHKPKVGGAVSEPKNKAYRQTLVKKQPRAPERLEGDCAPLPFLNRLFGHHQRQLDFNGQIILAVVPNYRLNLIKEWQKNLEAKSDTVRLKPDLKAKDRGLFRDLFPVEAAKRPAPAEVFLSRGVAPELLQVLLRCLLRIFKRLNDRASCWTSSSARSSQPVNTGATSAKPQLPPCGCDSSLKSWVCTSEPGMTFTKRLSSKR